MRKAAVGTVKKSQAAMWGTWLARKVRQVWDGGFLVRSMYLATVRSATWWPSSRSSERIRGAPQSGFSRDIWRIRSRISAGVVGRPGFPTLHFHRQKSLNACRCQRMTVSGWTMARAERQLDQRRGTPTGPEAGEQDPEKAVPKPQLGAFAGVLKDGDLLPEGEILGGEAEPGCQECSEEKENRLDEAHGLAPGVAHQSDSTRQRPGSKRRNSLWWNENGIIARHNQQGADVQRLLHHLSVYLGHVHLQDTQVYLSMTPELLREASQRFERYAGKERRHA